LRRRFEKPTEAISVSIVTIIMRSPRHCVPREDGGRCYVNSIAYFVLSDCLIICPSLALMDCPLRGDFRGVKLPFCFKPTSSRYIHAFGVTTCFSIHPETSSGHSKWRWYGVVSSVCVNTNLSQGFTLSESLTASNNPSVFASPDSYQGVACPYRKGTFGLAIFWKEVTMFMSREPAFGGVAGLRDGR